MPDLDHYRGSFGGRVFPLWADADATRPNLRPALLARLTRDLRRPVSAPDLMAYIAAVAAHPAYTERFQPELVQPGLRIPFTAHVELFSEAVALGQEVIWLHSYGERFSDSAAGRPPAPPRFFDDPTIPAEGAIPSDPDRFPDGDLRYDPDLRRLHVGAGFVDRVPAAVRVYEVSARNVLDQWFSYRRADRSRPLIGDRRPPSPLDSIRPEGWPASYTEDLLNLLHVLARLVALEPAQAVLLDRICTGPLIDARILRQEGVLDDDSVAVVRVGDSRQGELSL